MSGPIATDQSTIVGDRAPPATSYVVIVDAKGMVRYTGSGGTQALSAELAKVVAK